MAQPPLYRLTNSLFVLNDDGGIRAWGRNGQPRFFQKGQVLFHPPSCLVQAILNGVAYSAESLKIGRVKPKEGGIVRRLDYERVFKVNHVTPPALFQACRNNEWNIFP